MPTKIEKDEISGQHTTGHEWDGVKELNSPLPRWWLWLFYVTIAFSIGYWVAYPAWPVPGGYTKGALGYSSRAEVAKDLKALGAFRAGFAAKIDAASLDEIVKTPELREVALAAGRATFANNCAPCHGANAGGRPGYPNLNSDNWLWGGTLAEIHQTITHGVRWESDPDTRASQMPAFGADGILTKEQILDVAEHVRSLKGRGEDAAAADRGAAVFAENCASCHGAGGEGIKDFGAPALKNPSRLYGDAKADIVAQVTKPRHGVMPSWSQRLDGVTIKEVAIYVHSLGGGQ